MPLHEKEAPETPQATAARDAIAALGSSDLLTLGMAADALRRRKHPENVVTYALNGQPARSIEEAARNTSEVMLSAIPGMAAISSTAFATQLESQRQSTPWVTFHHLPLSCLRQQGHGNHPVVDGMSRLRDAGLRSIHLDFQKDLAVIPPSEVSRLLQAARTLDLSVSASFTITSGEPLEQRMHDLATLRTLQQETQAILSVLVRIQHASTPEARREEEATAVDYLKTLAVIRTFLDTIEHVQADWSVMGPKVLELALRFGADDAGTVARSQAGPEPSHHGGESELRRIIRDAGFRPVERDPLFRQCLLH